MKAKHDLHKASVAHSHSGASLELHPKDAKQSNWKAIPVFPEVSQKHAATFNFEMTFNLK